MNKRDLLQLIQINLNNAQPSERWAMYRLIAPIVDFANLECKYHVYFELAQTSTHKTNQAVDIALLDNSQPVVMIEAKRVNRRISAEQIAKYLQPGVRGIVTNGAHWILSLNDQSKAISILEPNTCVANDSAIDEIIAFIQGKLSPSPDWTFGNQYIDASIKPTKIFKEARSVRNSNPVCIASDATSMREVISRLDTPSQLDKALIESIIEQLEKQGGIPKHLRTEVRCSRVAFFDERITSGSKRIARIELGKNQPDILILTAMENGECNFSKIAPPVPHDKGPHMRRFRLINDSQASAFGKHLALALSINGDTNAA